MARITTKRMGRGWYRAEIKGHRFDIEFCDPREGWGFTGWMYRDIDRPMDHYSDPMPTKAACLKSLELWARDN